jgi:hypothetical protein
MNRETRAIIRWVPPSRRGRPRPPNPPAGYTAPARFESDPQSARGDWSLRIIASTDLRGEEVIDATVCFLVPEAPQELLSEGERFELLEGKRVVAKGVILPAAVAASNPITEFELALLG